MDLLGDPTDVSKPAADGGDFDMGDLLGSDPAPTNKPSLGDDLLFAGTGGGGAVSGGSFGGGDEKAEVNPAMLSEMKQGPSVPLQIGPVADVDQALVNFATDKTYYLRFGIRVLRDGSRSRVIIAITDTALQLLAEGTGEAVLEVAPKNVIGFVTQATMYSKRLSKELEMQGVVQIIEGADLHFGFPKEGKSVEVAINEFASVLSAVCGAHGNTLPVCTLPQSENIQDHVLKFWMDPRLRRQLVETLAYRTELRNELTTLSRDDEKVELKIDQIKDTGHEVVNVVEEIQRYEQVCSNSKTKIDELQRMVDTAKSNLAQVQSDLKAEEGRRETAVREAAEDSQKQRLMKQVADYEVAKAKHRRELDNITSVTSFYERRLKDRAAEVYTAQTLPFRIEDLEEQLEEVEGHLARRNRDHSQFVMKLTENRKRIEGAKNLVEQLKDDIRTIETARIDEDLPPHVASMELPDLNPVYQAEPTEPTEPAAAAVPPPQVASAPTAPSGSSAAVKPIVLSDDDDI